MTRPIAIAAAIAVMTGLLAISAFATSVIALTDEQVFGKADVVARGRVAAIEVQERADSSSKIVTVVRIDVMETLKGTIAADPKNPKIRELVIDVPGGKIGEMGVAVMGAPVFVVGDDVVVAVENRDGQTASLVVGFFQGRYTVLDPGEKSPLIVRDPWRESVEKVRACKGDLKTCVGSVEKSFSLDQARIWSKITP